MDDVNALVGAVAWLFLGILIGAGFVSLGEIAYGRLTFDGAIAARGWRRFRRVILGSLLYGTVFAVTQGVPGPLADRPW
ncbi:hypothetical protein KZZ52_27695 [Dactylosporangium sp. AC04546]|uniref:hypothetical protein n=1 Tax=Dactylosporangium sp. AC04546 TaxID=2862460 RepID=UPI001EDCE87F|nr:hypothetical protein [Dactylosporangium sp. AC04546]WVK89051.1 hypothetical protein KZZ52_27695 [Dactylosporangium sp. AC04546]